MLRQPVRMDRAEVVSNRVDVVHPSRYRQRATTAAGVDTVLWTTGPDGNLYGESSINGHCSISADWSIVIGATQENTYFAQTLSDGVGRVRLTRFLSGA